MPRSLRLERQEEKLAELYRQAEAKLIAQVADDIERGAMGTARYRRRRIETIRGALSDLQDEAVPLATEVSTAAYIEGATAAAAMTGSAPPDFGSGVHREAMEMLADNLASDLNGAAETVGRRVEDVYRKAGLEAAASKIAEGTTVRDATKTLTELLRQQGLSAGPGGARSWRLSRYAEMVVRTNTTDAIVRGNVNAAVSDGWDLVEVLVVEDERTCEICGPYHEQVYTLGDREGYDTLDELPPFHPNCRCDLNILTEDPNAS